MHFFLSLLFAASAPSIDESSAHDIDSVVAFSDRAEVTRLQQVSCTKGQALAEFLLTPLTLDERSLSASASSGQVQGIAVERESPPVQLSEASPAVVKQRRQLRALTDKIESLRQQLVTLSTYQAIAGQTIREDMRSQKPNAESWRKAQDAQMAMRSDLLKQQTQLLAEQRQLEREIRALEVNAQRPERTAPFHRVRVSIACNDATKVALSYVVNEVAWVPEYDVHFSGNVHSNGKPRTGNAQVTVSTSAALRQWTGEDWTDVAIALSTAKPALGSRVRMPREMWVQSYERKLQKTLVRGSEDRSGLADGNAPAQATRSDVEDGGKAFTLTVTDRVTLLSDAKSVWLPLRDIEGKGTVKLVATPKLSAWVLSVGALNNPSEVPLLAGNARLYLNQRFVGETALRYTAPGELLELPLGAANEVLVERENVKAKDKDAGFLQSQRTFFRHYRTHLANFSGNDETIEVRDHIPVSTQADLEASLDSDKTTSGYQYDKTRGILVWQVKVGKHSRQAVDTAYKVKVPEDWAM